MRDGTRLALRETYEATLVAALARFAGRATLPGAVRATAYRALFDLHRMPAEWDGLWWRLGPLGYVEDARDATARPAETRDWAGTSAVTAALHAALDDPDPLVRRAAVENATLALDRGTVDRLLRLFDDPAAAGDRPAILTALGSARDPRAAGPVLAVLRRHSENADLLLPAIAAARQQGGPSAKDALAKLAAAEIPPRPLIAALRAVGELEVADAVPAAGPASATPPRKSVPPRSVPWPGSAGTRPSELLISALGDADLGVRRLAVTALGRCGRRPRYPRCWRRTGTPRRGRRRSRALSRMPDARALDVYLEGLGAKNPGVRDECRKALAAIRRARCGRRSGTGLLRAPCRPRSSSNSGPSTQVTASSPRCSRRPADD